MEKSGLPPFYVGQKVIYITGLNAPKNSIHTVKDIIKYPCGCYLLDIGCGGLFKSNALFLTCDMCNKQFINNGSPINGWNPSSFRPAKEQTFPLMTYSKIIEKELVSMN